MLQLYTQGAKIFRFWGSELDWIGSGSVPEKALGYL